MSRTSIIFALICLAGCAQTGASPTERAAFDTCNRQAWHDWAAKPHLAYAFGAVGALFDSSMTADSAKEQLDQCMATKVSVPLHE
jgi:hypothetical protein